MRKHGIECHSRWQYEKRLSGGGGGIEEVHESHGSEVEHVREKSCMSYQQVKVKGKRVRLRLRLRLRLLYGPSQTKP